MKKVLITGVNGFLGTQLFKSLGQSSNYVVYGVSRSQSDLDNILQVSWQDIIGLNRLFKEHSFDIVINLASKMAEAKELKDACILRDNQGIANNLINALGADFEGQLINFSSTSIYPNVDGEFFEYSLPEPSRNGDALYGLSKLNQEEIFKFKKPVNSYLLNLRAGMIHGPGMRSDRIHEIFKEELLKANTITIWGDGSRIIPIVSIDYIKKVIPEIIDQKLQGTYNLVEENTSIQEIANRLISKFGNSKSLIQYVAGNNNMKFRVNFDKIKRALND